MPFDWWSISSFLPLSFFLLYFKLFLSTGAATLTRIFTELNARITLRIADQACTQAILSAPIT